MQAYTISMQNLSQYQYKMYLLLMRLRRQKNIYGIIYNIFFC